MPTTMKMEQNDHPILAGLSAVLSFCSGVFALITINEVQLIMTIIVSGIGGVSGLFAIRHYWFATRKIIRENKKQDQQ